LGLGIQKCPQIGTKAVRTFSRVNDATLWEPDGESYSRLTFEKQDALPQQPLLVGPGVNERYGDFATINQLG